MIFIPGYHRQQFYQMFPHRLAWIVIIPASDKVPLTHPQSTKSLSQLEAVAFFSAASPFHFQLLYLYKPKSAWYTSKTLKILAIKQVPFALVLHVHSRLAGALHCIVLTSGFGPKGTPPSRVVLFWRQWKERSKSSLALVWIAGNSHYLRPHFMARPNVKGNREMPFCHMLRWEYDPEYLRVAKLSVPVGFSVTNK